MIYRLLSGAQEVGRRLHIPGVRSQSGGIRVRDSWWTKWQYNRFLIRVLSFLPVTVNSELTLLVAREDVIKQVSRTIWSLSFPLSRFLCFSHIISYIRFYLVSFSSLYLLSFLPSILFFSLFFLNYYCMPHFSLFLQYFVFTVRFVFFPPCAFRSFCPFFPFCSYFLHSTPVLISF